MTYRFCGKSSRPYPVLPLWISTSKEALRYSTSIRTNLMSTTFYVQFWRPDLRFCENQLPATIIREIMIVGEAILARSSRSLPTCSML